LRTAVEKIEPDCVLLDGGQGATYGSSWDDAAWLGTRSRPVAVIMFTGHGEAVREAEEEVSARSQAAHFVSILPKPFDLKDLIRQVQQATHKATTSEEQ
jgi:FixJ family two-component response regulator